MKYKYLSLVILGALLSALLNGCARQPGGAAKAELPVDRGYAEGKEIYFTHTEVSSPDAAEKMTAAMGSPVLYASSLSTIPEEALANVYSFTNGVKGDSMSGYQLSVFDSPPGTDGYSPLRRMVTVTWVDESKAREVKTAAEILNAEKAGELKTQQTPLVINMPFIIWDGGQR